MVGHNREEKGGGGAEEGRNKEMVGKMRSGTWRWWVGGGEV